MKNIFNSFLLFFGGILFIYSCGNNSTEPLEIGDKGIQSTTISDEIEVSQSQFELGKMKLGQITNANFPSTIRATGRIEIPTKNQVKVSAYSGGYVTSINLMPDERVNKGQTLFTLENPELVQMQQEYLETKEQLNYLQSDYERQKTLAAENVASQKNFLKAESKYLMTLAKKEGLKKQLSLLKINTENINPYNLVSKISITSPVNGYISAVHAMKGMYQNPTDVALEILNIEHLHLELSIFEKDILKIKKGQNLTFKIPEASNEIYEAQVHLIGKTVDNEKRVVRVHANLKNKKDNQKLIAGMYVDAEIITADNQTSGLPESAIVSEDGKDYVLIHKGSSNEINRFEKKEVTTGQRKNGLVQIVNDNDFTNEENILIDGAFNLIGIE